MIQRYVWSVYQRRRRDETKEGEQEGVMVVVEQRLNRPTAKRQNVISLLSLTCQSWKERQDCGLAFHLGFLPWLISLAWA